MIKLFITRLLDVQVIPCDVYDVHYCYQYCVDTKLFTNKQVYEMSNVILIISTKTGMVIYI